MSQDVTLLHKPAAEVSAEALERARPGLAIYAHHDHAVRRGFFGALDCALPDGA